MSPRLLSSDPDTVERCFDRFAVQIKGPQAGKRANLSPSQRKIVRAIYARDAEGKRRYNTILVVGPKKVGKSFWVGHLGIFELTLFGQHGGDVYGLASSFKQGDEIYRPALHVVKYSEQLQKLNLEIRPSTKEIRFPALDAKFQVLSTGSGGRGDELHGKAPRVLLVDELHALRNRAAYENVREGMMIWEQLDPVNSHFTLFTTNWGEIGSSAAFWEELEYAREVQKNPNFDPTWFVDIAEPPGDLDVEDLLKSPKAWFDFHTGLQDGLISERFLRSKASEALRKPSMRPRIVRLHFCRAMPSEFAAFDVGRWDKCAVEGLDDSAFEGEPCFAGIDLSSTTDLTACTWIIPEETDEEDESGEKVVRLNWFSRAWLPANRIEKLEEITKKPLAAWVDDGILHTTPGDTVDDRVVGELIRDLYGRFDLRQFGIDPKFASRLARDFVDDGLPVVSLSQGFKTFTEPFQSIERHYLAGPTRLRHSGSPLVRWNAESLHLKQADDGGLRPAKIERDAMSRRVDVMTAGGMAEWCRLHDPGASVRAGVWAG